MWLGVAMAVAMAALGAWLAAWLAENGGHETEHEWRAAEAKVVAAWAAAGRRGLPMACVDVAAFDRNVAWVAQHARGRPVRVASKSVRVPALLARVLAHSAFDGVMCYSAQEALFLCDQLPQLDDVLVAYPTVQQADLQSLVQLAERGVKVATMVDCSAHVLAAAHAMEGNAATLGLCIDVDASLRMLGLHIGVQRSPVRSLSALRVLVQLIDRTPGVHLAGVMTYEAQVAGVPDASPFDVWPLRVAIRLMQRVAIAAVAAKRVQIQQLLQEEGVGHVFHNGGGTGSIASSAADPSLTEITMGSGLLQPMLFSYTRRAARLQPALFHALQATRHPEAGVVVAHGGGFVASGEPGPSRAPMAVPPLTALAREGWGEVQSPLVASAPCLASQPLLLPPSVVAALDQQPSLSGQPSRGVLEEGHVLTVEDAVAIGKRQGGCAVGGIVVARPAKSGELAERFNEYLLFESDGSSLRTSWARTYRGFGYAFH